VDLIECFGPGRMLNGGGFVHHVFHVELWSFAIFVYLVVSLCPEPVKSDCRDFRL